MKGCHFRLCSWTSSLNNIYRLHIIAFLCDHMTKIRHSHVKILAILLWLSPDNTFCCFQLTNFDSLEKLVDFSTMVNSTLAMISKTLHYCVLFMLSTTYLSQSHLFSHSHSESLQLSFCFCSLSGHMVRAKKSFVNVKEHRSTILCIFPLLHGYVSIHIHKNL